MKRCFKCGQEKELSGFYAHPRMADKHLGKCKDCTKKDVFLNSLTPEHKVIEHARYLRRKEYVYKTSKAMILKYPEKYTCRNRFYAAVRDKKIIRQPCEKCGKPNAQGHHLDYSKPFDVVWLCSNHHGEIHRTVN
jgi:hypothetical protein